LYRAAQALAAVQGQGSVSRDQVQSLAGPVLAHRVLVRREALKDYPDGGAVMQEISNRFSG
jgi:MoxR-like ATPase